MPGVSKWRRVLLVVVGVALVAGAWWAYQAWRVSQDLSGAADEAVVLRAAVTSGDRTAARSALDRLGEHARSAADRTDGLAWSTLTWVPVVGDDARGVRVVADVLADLSDDGLAPVIRTASSLERLLPSGGRVSIDAVRELQRPVRVGHEALASAASRLAQEDPTDFVGRLRDRYRDLAGEVAKAEAALDAADAALRVMPAMLGEQERRKYLLVFQNNAEIRATGGLPGAVSLLEAEDGHLELTRQVGANTFGATDEPVLPMTEAEKALYRGQLGRWFLNANLTPDFPRAAQLWQARWEQVYDDDIDGVIALDPVVLSYLLEVLGPLQVGDLRLTGDNAVDELLHGVYVDHEDPAAQDAVFRSVAAATFDRVVGGATNPQGLLGALERGVDERRVFVWAASPAEQRSIGDRAVAGALESEWSASPVVDVSLSDGTGSKMSYYLRHAVRVESVSCTSDGVQTLRAKARLESVAPREAAELPPYITGGGQFGVAPGDQLVIVELRGPVGGAVEGIRLNGRRTGLDLVVDGRRQVATTAVYLEPGQRISLEWKLVSSAKQRGDARVSVTPGILPRAASSVVESSCVG